MDEVRWGIVATGGIAHSFAKALAEVPDARLVAVASRSADRADAFGDEFDVPRRHGSYEALAEDDAVDVVYIATPASRHHDDALLYLGAGKPVLCEKPFALNAVEAEEMIEAARRESVFLMEAMWSRFLPAYVTLQEMLSAGRIGEVRLVEASLGWRMQDVESGDRHFDPRLGGGGLLDLGVYAVQLCSLVLGEPDRVTADGHIGTTGVDEQVAALLGYDGGALGVVQAAIRTNLACTARISGTDGVVELPAFMHAPNSLTLASGVDRETIERPIDGQGLRFQVAEVHRCLREGRHESEVMPLAETRSIMRTLDRIRAAIDE